MTVASDPQSRYDSLEPAETALPPSSASERSRALALALGVMGGVFGLHRFYTGRVASGVCMCLTLGGMGIWYLYDVVVIAAGEFRDSEGRRVTRWELADVSSERPPGDRRVTDLEDRMLGLESQVSELAERLDFAERLLAQAREKGKLERHP